VVKGIRTEVFPMFCGLFFEPFHNRVIAVRTGFEPVIIHFNFND
jgi:hypothetical protein